MPKFSFSPEDLRRAFAVAKLVKPMTGDFVLKVSGNRLSVFSSDRRRFARAEVTPSSSDADPSYVSDEYFLPADRHSFFDSNLESVVISTSEKGLTVKTEGAGGSRSSSARSLAPPS